MGPDTFVILDPVQKPQSHVSQPCASHIDDVDDDEDITESDHKPQDSGDDGPMDNSDDDAAPAVVAEQFRAKVKRLPTKDQIQDALADLEKLLRPPQEEKQLRYKDPAFDKKTVERLQAMKLFCFNLLDMEGEKANPKEKIWTRASIQTARSLGYCKNGSQKPGKKNQNGFADGSTSSLKIARKFRYAIGIHLADH
jgi:hypothetical protein